MSHFLERQEKECLNCNTPTVGRYCHNCGQENVEPKETFWHLITHFFNDITHFDGKFFSTIKVLLFKPGHLTKEYNAGRRVTYLHPIRMYIFTSAFFFVLFFWLTKKNEQGINATLTVAGVRMTEIEKMDSLSFAKFTAHVNKQNGRDSLPMTRQQFKIYADSVFSTSGFHWTTSKYTSHRQYDSVLASGKKKHNWLERQLIHKEIEVNEKYHNNTEAILDAFSEKFKHSFPQMLFWSLPFVALLLKLLYVRKRREIYYATHFIYVIHLYCATFVLILVNVLIVSLLHAFKLEEPTIIKLLFGLIILFYWYKAMRNFYHQSRAKTITKYLLLLFLFAFIMVFAFAALFFVTAYSI